MHQNCHVLVQFQEEAKYTMPKYFNQAMRPLEICALSVVGTFFFFRQWAYYIVPFCLSEHFADARENSDKRKKMLVYTSSI